MTAPATDPLDSLTALETALAEQVKEAREDGKRWRLLRHWVNPKAREDEFTGYMAETAAAKQLLGAGDNPGATSKLEGLKAAFDAAAADFRAQPQDLLESFFGLNAQEAARYEGYAGTVAQVLKPA